MESKANLFVNSTILNHTSPFFYVCKSDNTLDVVKKMVDFKADPSVAYCQSDMKTHLTANFFPKSPRQRDHRPIKTLSTVMGCSVLA